MDIFSIPQPPYKELAFLEHELDLLSKMWGVVAEWETTYGGWKNGHFKELKASTPLPHLTACSSLQLHRCRPAGKSTVMQGLSAHCALTGGGSLAHLVLRVVC
jgi:hypothetical protein